MAKNTSRKSGHGQDDQGVSRRSFLKGGGFAAGALLLAGSSINLVGCGNDASGGSSNASEQSVGSGAQSANYEVYETDVLVIGGGTAGYPAAFEAQLQGLDVMMVDKGPWAAGGVTGMNFDYLSTWCTDPALYMTHTMTDVIFNQHAHQNARIYAEERNARNALITTGGANTDFDEINRGQCWPVRNEDGSYHVKADLPTSGTRLVESTFMRHEQDHLLSKNNVAVFDRTMLTEFLIQDGECVGAMGIHLPTGTFRVYRAKATVMCTGGTCWINGWNTVAPNSGSVPDNTSDLEMAAFRRGAQIADAEWADYDLITVYPTGISCGYAAGLGADSYSVGYIKNKDGKTFLYDPKDPNKWASDRKGFVRAVGMEIYEGRGSENGGVYVDYTTPEAQAMIRYFYKRNIALFKEEFNIDATNELIECGFEMIEHSGSVIVDENVMSVEYPGLFSSRGAGLIGAAGSPGMSKNYLLSTFAGGKAAEYAKKSEGLTEFDWSEVETEYSRLNNLRTKSEQGGLRPVEIRRMIQRAGGTCLGVIRGTEELEAAKVELERIRKEDMPKQIVTESTLAYNMEWKEAIENYNLLDISELMVRATLDRQESRGSYLRPDYPQKDDENWACSLAYRFDDGQFTSEKITWPQDGWDTIKYPTVA